MTSLSLSDLESEARSLIAKGRDTEELSTARIAILNVFSAYYTRAYSVESLALIIEGAEGIKIAPSEIARAASKLVRAKVLRSRRQFGTKVLYEIAFTR